MPTSSPPNEREAGLCGFRQKLYGCLGRRSNALFELCDAILTSGAVPSPPHLSLTSVHRRGWGSLYAALSKGEIDAEAFRGLLASYDLNTQSTPVYAVDKTSWPRDNAETSPERGYLYHPSRHLGGKPIVAGWAYQMIAGLSFERNSWVAPVDARRVEPQENTEKVAAGQVRALLERLPGHGDEPLFVFDAGYAPVTLQLELQGCDAQILVRLKPRRAFYFDPEVSEKSPVGRPPTHGAKFDFKDSGTWPEPTHEYHRQTDAYGSVTVRAWSGVHPKTRQARERYHSDSACVIKGTVVLVEVGRLPHGERRRQPKAL